jgi:hypothetical protein
MKTSRILTLFVLLLASVAALAERTSVEGRITSITRERDEYRVTLEQSGATFYVSRNAVRESNLGVDTRVRFAGNMHRGVMTVDSVTVLSGRGDRGERRRAQEENGSMRGVVESLNRHLNYLTIRDDSTGRYIKIDVRHMDRERPVNVWAIRRGDHVRVRGQWENRDTFDAERIWY